jgi:hypothetical protein
LLSACENYRVTAGTRFLWILVAFVADLATFGVTGSATSAVAALFITVFIVMPLLSR